MYHEFADCMITMHVDFVPNLIFSKYNVKVKLNGIEKEVLEHGEDRDFSFKVKPGQCTVSFENVESSSVTGEIAFNVKGTINTSVKISCHSDKIDVKTEFIEDMGALEDGQLMISASNADYKGTKFADTKRALEDLGFENIQTEPVYDAADGGDDLEKVIEVSINGGKDYKRGDVFDSDTAVVISYHANENDDPVKIAEAEKLKALEGNVPKEMASRAIIVAMTNCESTDVFESDGNTYDTAKFHSYDNIDDFFMVIYEDGEWSVVDETKWHVSGMVLRMYDRDMYLKVDCDISKNEDNYIVENVDRAMAAKEDLENEDLSKVHMEPSESNSFLTVQGTLIESDRDETLAWEKMTAKEERQKWIEDQFHWWDGRHIELSELIKDNLNDAKSFEHVEVKYVDVYDEERKKIVNGVLADVGVSQRVEIGDLFVMETFTAKNAFNATIKSTGYGIVGAKACAAEDRGICTERGDTNRRIRMANIAVIKAREAYVSERDRFAEILFGPLDTLFGELSDEHSGNVNNEQYVGHRDKSVKPTENVRDEAVSEHVIGSGERYVVQVENSVEPDRNEHNKAFSESVRKNEHLHNKDKETNEKFVGNMCNEISAKPAKVVGGDLPAVPSRGAAKVKTEIVAMLDRVMELLGRLVLPVVHVKFLGKISDREQMRDIGTVKKFLLRNHIETFAQLEAYRVKRTRGSSSRIFYEFTK